ncbi:MAG: T9SS type A sorting domain-containing protein [Flavobacteriales bacterium]|nr:T9SS type A sorting domain-containing protein [Flavobacteriales bacterium]
MAAESFWDEDPGFGVGDPIGGWIVSADTSGEFQVHVPSNIGWGHHLLYVRTLDQHGHWSLTNWAVDSVFVDPTDLGDLTAQTGISVYPNPFAETVTVQPAEAKPLRVILYDPQGKLVYDKMLTATTTIDLNGMVAGGYTAFFWQDQERIHRTTLIKQ